MSSAMAEERGWMTIGEVLSLLTREFPEISISKIRFLEGEGLIAPERAKSGYRRFTDDDIDQLRLVLVAQRDRYLPLKVIKDHLAAGTLRAAIDPQPVVEVQPEPAAALQEQFAFPAAPADAEGADDDIGPAQLFSRAEVVSRSGLSDSDLGSLIDAGVISVDPTGRLTGADLLVCRAFAVLQQFGIDERHMRQARNAASRESYLIGNVVGHLSGPERAEATTRMLRSFSDAHYWLAVADLHRQNPSASGRPGGPRRR